MKDILQPLVKEFMPFAQERMGFKKPPRIFLRNDPENAQNPLGKTAYYDPQEMSVTLYINGRHPKDIMRSLSHELVHHTQNCNGESMCQQCAPNPCSCGMMQEQEEELEEGGAALRVGNEDRHHQRQAHADRIHEEEEAEEKELKNPEKADLDNDGKISPYEKKRGAAIEKSMKNKKDMNEAQIRHLIRKLVKEAMKRKETK